MFDIEYKGGTTVVITTKKAKLVTDPKLSLLGLKDVSTKDVVAVATEERFALTDGEVVNISGPGEYEVADFTIRGIAATRHIDTPEDKIKRATIYRIEISDVRVAFIGHIDGEVSDDQLEMLGMVDIVCVPVGGGGYTLDAVQATKLVRKIDAKLVIPMHYADKNSTFEVPQDELELFEKEFGGQIEHQTKLKIKSAASLPTIPTIYELARS